MLFLKWLMIWWRFSRDPEYSRVNSMLPRRLVWELQNVPEVSPRLDQRRGGLEEVGPGGQWLWSLWPFFIIFPYFAQPSPPLTTFNHCSTSLQRRNSWTIAAHLSDGDLVAATVDSQRQVPRGPRHLRAFVCLREDGALERWLGGSESQMDGEIGWNAWWKSTWNIFAHVFGVSCFCSVSYYKYSWKYFLHVHVYVFRIQCPFYHQRGWEMAFLVSAVNLGKQPPTREWNCPYDLLKFIY